MTVMLMTLSPETEPFGNKATVSFRALRACLMGRMGEFAGQSSRHSFGSWRGMAPAATA